MPGVMPTWTSTVEVAAGSAAPACDREREGMRPVRRRGEGRAGEFSVLAVRIRHGRARGRRPDR